MVPLAVVELTAQPTTSKGNQLVVSIHEKLGVGDVGFLHEAMQEHRRGSSLAAAADISLHQQHRVGVDVDTFSGRCTAELLD